MIIYKQVSAIPYRYNDDNLQILILTSRSNKNWIIPKGLIDEGDSELKTALKETKEEAGVTGIVIDKPVGTYTYKKWQGQCQVTVYPLEVSDIFIRWDEMDFRKRKWVSGEEAVKKVKPKSVAKLINKFITEMGKK